MVRRWTDEEIEYLKKYYGVIPLKEIAKKLNRSTSSVYCKGRELGLTGRGNPPKFLPNPEVAVVRGIVSRFREKNWNEIYEAVGLDRERAYELEEMVKEIFEKEKLIGEAATEAVSLAESIEDLMLIMYLIGYAAGMSDTMRNINRKYVLVPKYMVIDGDLIAIRKGEVT